MDLTNKKVLVVGLARSGMAAINLLHKLNAEIILSERKAESEIEQASYLKSIGVTIVNQDEEVFKQQYDLAVKNPGINYRDEKIQLLKNNGIKVITEIELAFLVSRKQHYLAITGTNGKTTTTSLLYEILQAKYHDKALLGGNIGIPLCQLVLDHNLIENEGYYIALEMSNFQLVDCYDFHPEAAVITNLTPDHLDIMKTAEEYYRSKLRVYQNMSEDDLFVVNDDDEVLLNHLAQKPLSCQTAHFSLKENSAAVSYVKDNYIYLNNQPLLDINKLKVVGKHNWQNIMVAAIISKHCKVDDDTIRAAIYNFKGVKHRLEFVREYQGVKYYNDSKGTNTDATIIALKSFDKGVILLVGGYEKGLPMDELKKHLTCVKQVIGFGYSGRRIVTDLVGEKGTVVDDLTQAVKLASEIAQNGDIILLSPTTSSFDQYSCFEERGEHFIKLVNTLGETNE
ncbi:MAG: UDP-N-acetylmuramoyl-L-alanine--D-glutamate ligase [Erysipelotrichaceae bacterium]